MIQKSPFLPHLFTGSPPAARSRTRAETIQTAPAAGIHRRNARIQSLLRVQDVAQRHEKAYPRQRHARRHADRGDQLGPPVRIRRREVRERIHRRLLQHQAFHGHRTDRIGRGEHAHGSARRRTLGDSDSRHLHFIRRDVARARNTLSTMAM